MATGTIFVAFYLKRTPITLSVLDTRSATESKTNTNYY